MALENGWSRRDGSDLLVLGFDSSNNGAWTLGDSNEIGLYGSLGLALRRTPYPYGATDGDTLAEYPCNEGTGTTIADRLAAFNMAISGSAVAAQIWTTLDGTSAYTPAYLRGASVGSFNWGAGGVWTVDVILYVIVSPTAPTNFHTFFSSTEGVNTIDMKINGGSDDYRSIVVGSGGTVTSAVAGTIVPGYQHYRLTNDNAGNLISYLDGAQLDSDAATHAFTSAGNATIRIGANTAGTQDGGSYLMGVRLSKVVRADTPQLFSTTAQNATSPLANLADWYPMRRGIRRVHVVAMGSGGQISVSPVVDGNAKDSLGNITTAGVASFDWFGTVETPKTSIGLRFGLQADSGATAPPLRVVAAFIEPVASQLTPAIVGSMIGQGPR